MRQRSFDEDLSCRCEAKLKCVLLSQEGRRGSPSVFAYMVVAVRRISCRPVEPLLVFLGFNLGEDGAIELPPAALPIIRREVQGRVDLQGAADCSIECRRMRPCNLARSSVATW
jgi:hypothetical protein